MQAQVVRPAFEDGDLWADSRLLGDGLHDSGGVFGQDLTLKREGRGRDECFLLGCDAMGEQGDEVSD